MVVLVVWPFKSTKLRGITYLIINTFPVLATTVSVPSLFSLLLASVWFATRHAYAVKIILTAVTVIPILVLLFVLSSICNLYLTSSHTLEHDT
ncbi:uncharacterized protein BJ212DRAFT_533762 [Suillus subaureus]|uniref:Uncharacterized protein n=1 Tax=Suillus subaureus TaxID=48587 RepID=A0A9P7ELM2_9AGAM|nr:uncharacterized protein BJ212DRAFT_533762 [Suillus subaureus]KAG1824545.1 hypothetical protein BJ212DRAFT_533762 [Suillus subaureus]